jgi:hypothetical protein
MPCTPASRIARSPDRSDRAGAVDLAALHVERADRLAHALRAHRDHVDVGRELFAQVGEVPQQEAVGEPERGAGAQRGEDLPVQLGLGGVRDQEDDQVGTGDHLVHLTEGAVRLAEPGGAGGLEGR